MEERRGRRAVSVRLTWTGVARIDRLAEREGVDRSEMVRKLLSEAIQRREAQDRRR